MKHRASVHATDNAEPRGLSGVGSVDGVCAVLSREQAVFTNSSLTEAIHKGEKVPLEEAT